MQVSGTLRLSDVHIEDDEGKLRRGDGPLITAAVGLTWPAGNWRLMTVYIA